LAAPLGGAALHAFDRELPPFEGKFKRRVHIFSPSLLRYRKGFERMPDGRDPISDETRITARLIDLICEMSISQQLDLLDQLDRRQYKSGRADHRRDRTILVDYEVNNLLRQDFIRDISKVGVFIETPAPPPVGEKIRLSFSLTDAKKPIRVTGRIVRATEKGFAVDFRHKTRK
jgi:hypothetical protein